MSEEGFLATLMQFASVDSPAEVFASEEGVSNARNGILYFLEPASNGKCRNSQDVRYLRNVPKRFKTNFREDYAVFLNMVVFNGQLALRFVLLSQDNYTQHGTPAWWRYKAFAGDS